MRVVYITESHEARAGGIPTVVDELARQVRGQGAAVEIVSVGHEPLPAPAGAMLRNAVPARLSGPWRWSADLKRHIEAAAGDGAFWIFHLHGIWLASHWYGARIARQRRIPTIMSVHGQLEPYHWTDRGLLHSLKKSLYWRLIAYPAFRTVRVIHAITPQERDHLSSLFRDQEIVLIPNAADLEEIDRALGRLPDPVGRESVIAFLGRFHPKKGVDILIRAFAEAALPRQWRLVLAGTAGKAAYMSELQRLATTSPARDRITFIGPLSGAAKWQFYRTAAVVAVPSLSEVIGLVNLEAAACGTPTITTYDTGLLDWEAGGGILINPKVRELAEALNSLCLADTTEWQRRSVAARHLVETQYSWAKVRQLWLNLYRSVLSGQERITALG